MPMDAVTQVLATTGEISLKGGNRPRFERRLTDNLRAALADLPVIGVTRPAWRVLVTLARPVPFAEVARRLATVFGLTSFMPVRHAGRTLPELAAVLSDELSGLEPASFAVRCIRSDKRFPLTSPEIEREVGRRIQEQFGWRVDLSHPELTVHVLVDVRGLYLWTHRVGGPGGLPVGVGGRALNLLSGGIDSPVAAWMMMKRGMRLDFVHFHSMPRTDPASVEKVRELVALLNRFQCRARLAVVPLLPIQEQVVARCPAPLRVLLYRRFMMRLAERLARRFRCHALVTGESLGQVSSQTIENLSAVEAVVKLPVLRPLIGLDKQEIIALGRRLGSYEISIQPHMDCCSFLLPPSPATHSSAAELATAEADLDVPGLVAQALRASTIHDVREVVAWEQMPVPRGVEP
jgi:thiamine biosynthesis protein ThiI